MRRCLIVIVVAACVVAGCGSSSSSSSSPLAKELSYLPSGSPLVMTIVTDPNSAAIKGVQALVNRFPLGSAGEAALKSRLQQSGVNYDGDIRPLLGNPVALSVNEVASSAPSSTQTLLVWVTNDADKLKSLVQKAMPGSKSTGTRDGATMYQANGGGDVVAIDGATAVIGNSAAVVTSALDRHAHGGGIGDAAYSHALSGLPGDGVVNAFGDLTGLLSQPSAAKARQVPWVAALKGYAETVTASSTGLWINYHVDTTGRPLTAAQLPFAQGMAAPTLAGNGPVTVGIHNPAQIASFIESAAQATDPGGYVGFLKRQAVVRARTGVDLNSLIKLMTGDLMFAYAPGSEIARLTLSDPAAANDILSKLSRAPRSTLRGGQLKRVGNHFELVNDTGSAIPVTIVGNQLVLGKATLGQLRAFAAAPVTQASWAHGTVAFRVRIAELLPLLVHSSETQVLQSILSQLTDLTGSSSVSPSGITGSATLGVR